MDSSNSYPVSWLVLDDRASRKRLEHVSWWVASPRLGCWDCVSKLEPGPCEIFLSDAASVSAMSECILVSSLSALTWHFQRVLRAALYFSSPKSHSRLLPCVLHCYQVCWSRPWKLGCHTWSIRAVTKGGNHRSQTSTHSNHFIMTVLSSCRKEDYHCPDGDHWKSPPFMDVTNIYWESPWGR